MSGPIIPADQWPELAMCHCWDKSGTGKFYGVRPNSHGIWGMSIEDGIPLPAGHDWRVPVMRPSEQATAIDLEQFRDLVGFACLQAINLPETDPRRDYIRQCSDLLALIDGQATKGEGV